MIVEPILLIDFVGAGNDHPRCGTQGNFLGLDLVLGFDDLAADPRSEQSLTLDAPERMACMYQRETQKAGKPATDIAGIRVMAVDEMGQPVLCLQIGQGVVGEGIQMIPKRLLLDIGFGPGINAHNVRLGAENFLDLRIIRVNLRIHDPAGHQIDARHFGQFRQGTDQFDHIKGLAAGIGIPTQFEIVTPNQSVDADHQEVDSPCRRG